MAGQSKAAAEPSKKNPLSVLGARAPPAIAYFTIVKVYLVIFFNSARDRPASGGGVLHSRPL